MNDRDLDEIYRRSSAADTLRPSRQIRETILAHAARMASARHPRSFGLRTPNLLLRLWASSRTRSWRLVAPVAAAVLAAAILVPIWHSPVQHLAAPSTADQSAPALAPSLPNEITPAPVPAERQEQRLAAPAAAPAAPAAAPAVMPRPSADDDLAPARAAPAAAAARSARIPDAPTQEIQRAAAAGDTQRLMRLLNEHPTLIETRDELGRTPLMLATLGGQGGTVSLLLAHGANPDSADSAGRTPLEVARGRGEAAISAELARARSSLKQ